jgi:hypothetical protein
MDNTTAIRVIAGVLFRMRDREKKRLWKSGLIETRKPSSNS